LGRLFPSHGTDDKDACVVYVGCRENLLERYIIPNIGLDHTVHHINVDPSYPEALTEDKLPIKTIEVRQINRLLGQRYSNIGLIKEAQVITILVGTVVVNGYLELINNVKSLIERAGKKHYELLVGKLDEPKLKNISIIDLYCIVGCRETSLIDSRQFLIPVVTPHELFMALQPDAFPWQCKIITDFRLLNLSTAASVDAKEDDDSYGEDFDN
jgi:diphthamide biosynthesis enzyme Dph1/Dph2-like protein